MTEPVKVNPGTFERKYWEQIAMLSPALRSMVKSYDAHFGSHHYPLEKTIAHFATFLKRPIRHGELNGFVCEFFIMFLSYAAASLDHVNSTASRWFVFSRICNRQVIKLLLEQRDG